jgi:pyroglutamyl-peptidase
VRRVLVTGFEPFGGAVVNPSELLVRALAAAPPAGIELATAVLPVSYGRADDLLETAVRSARPELVVCFGQADGRSGISVERVALNLDDTERPDSDGVVSRSEIDPTGPVAYRSTLPVDEIVAALRAEGIPAASSRDAGGYLCNRVFYKLMRLLGVERPAARGGFVHVPLLPEQTVELSAPSMALATVERAARVVIATAVAQSSAQRARASSVVGPSASTS